MNLLFEHRSDVLAAVPLLFAELCCPQEDASQQMSPAGDIDLEAIDDAAESRAQELEAVRLSAQDELRDALEARLQEGLEIERSAVTHICGSFAKARERYFAEVEGEVVRLSLAIAARVLQREAAFDPLLLQGVVCVALQKLERAEDTVLHIPAADAERWRAAMRVVPSLRIEGDAAMQSGECRLQAPSGAAELGIGAQLAEIERGFFDLLARRPA